MARRKQDWSPRGMILDRCDVTLEYDQLPHDFPEALELLDQLIHDSDPQNLIEEHDMLPDEAAREAERFKKLVQSYRSKEWWYVRIFAHTLVPTQDPNEKYMARIATRGDILESNWPPAEIKMIETAELQVLYEGLEEQGYNVKKFHVLRLGSFSLQHPKAPGEQTFNVDTKIWRSKGKR